MGLAPGYREAPAPGLACVWVSVAGAASRRTRVLPDGCVDVVWRRGAGAVVAGPDTTAQVIDAAPGDVFVGARFAAGTGAPALGLPLHALRDQRIALADVRPDLDERLPADLDVDEALAVLRTLCPPTPDPTVIAAVRALWDPHRRVRPLAAAIGLSERQLRRRCEVAVGYGPKHLQRVLRLQAFLARADAQDPEDGLPRLALDAGYSDQSHLTTDVRQLTGLTPVALLRERAGNP